MAKRRGPNEGAIIDRTDTEGRWEGRISLGWHNGKRRRRSIYAATHGELLEKMAKARKDLKLGLPLTSDRETVGSFLARWLEDSARPRIKPRTYERFAELLRLHIAPELASVKLEKLSPGHVQRLLTHKRREGFAAQTVVSIRNLLRAALNQALRWGIVGRNVATLVDVPRIERPPVSTLSADEARRFLEAAKGDRFEAVYTVGLALGLRRGELLGLQWDCVDLDNSRITIVRSLQRIAGKLQLTDTKTPKSRRTVPLPQYAVRALRAHRTRQLEDRLAAGPEWQERGLVFTNISGGPVEPVTLRRRFKRLLKAAGLSDARFHDLRHSAASLMLAQGVPLKTIQEILGHSSIAVTSGFYAHLGEQLKREAADAMDRVLGEGRLR
jgi:integrase